MRVSVVGLGRMGRFYARVIAAQGGVIKLAAVVESDPSVRADVQAELGVPLAFEEAESAFARPDIDAVVVATPTSTHARVVTGAAQAGKAIFCEKPLALSLVETRAALAAVERGGVLLQVGFMRRFDPAYQQARAMIEAGEIGQPTTFKSVSRDPTCPPVGYADPASSGGLVVDMGIHDFDLARWLMGSEVERVSAEGTRLACPELARVGDIDNAVINLRFASGAIGNVEVSRNARYGYDIRTEVLGSEAAVVVGGLSATDPAGVSVLRRPAVVEQAGEPHFVRRFSAAYTAQIQHFVDCVTSDRQPEVNGADALAAFEIAAAATRSWQAGGSVELTRAHD